MSGMHNNNASWMSGCVWMCVGAGSEEGVVVPRDSENVIFECNKPVDHRGPGWDGHREPNVPVGCPCHGAPVGQARR